MFSDVFDCRKCLFLSLLSRTWGKSAWTCACVCVWDHTSVNLLNCSSFDWVLLCNKFFLFFFYFCSFIMEQAWRENECDLKSKQVPFGNVGGNSKQDEERGGKSPKTDRTKVSSVACFKFLRKWLKNTVIRHVCPSPACVKILCS